MSNISENEGMKILEEAKEIIRYAIDNNDFDRIIYMGRRKKNIDSMTKIGYNILNMYEEILELEIENLYDGPVEDIKCPDQYFWIYKRVIEGILFYIKFKVIKESDEILFIMSFHEDGI